MDSRIFTPYESGLTPEQVATKLGVKRATVYAWISRGELRANKVGTRRYVTQAQMDAFALQRTSGEVIDMTYAYGPVR